MQDIYNPDNFAPYLYNAPETGRISLPFMLHANRMGCGCEEFFACTEKRITLILPFISCLTAVVSSTLGERIIY